MSDVSHSNHGEATHTDRSSAVEKPLPPVTEVGVVALALVVVGGIYLSSYFPKPASLLIPTILAIVSAIMVIFNAVSLVRARGLARDAFFKVGKWAQGAYIIIAGMLEYVFVLDGTRGGILVLLTLMLVVFAVDVPMIIAFTVARYHVTTSKD